MRSAAAPGRFDQLCSRSNYSFVIWERLATFAPDLIGLTDLTNECQFEIVREMLSLGLFGLFVLLFSPLRTFKRRVK